MIKSIWKRILIIFTLPVFWVILSGCRLPRTDAPLSTLLPPALTATYANSNAALSTITPEEAATKKLMLLPIVMRSGQVTSPVQLTLSTATVTPTATPEPPAEITLLFTGVIVPARCVEAGIDAHGDANYIFNEVRDMISSANLSVGTLNATLSDSSTHTGCIETYVLVGDSRSAVAMANAGFDVMSVATNHIKNCAGPSCGDSYNQAFIDTMDNLRANSILPVGAGMNAAEALQPVVVEVKGIRFGFVSLGMVEPMAFAGDNSPGIAELTDDNLHRAITNAKRDSDVVIAMPHWGPEDLANPNSYQLHFAQVAVQSGADVVVGNHTHVVQAIQQINGIDVFYGLGNFVFDQTWDLAHQQGVILLLHFMGKEYTGYELIPTHVDGDGTVHIAGPDEAAEIIKRIEDASNRLK
jgi:poly-gamma-glutamate synthesis protein (capsule biosynthesis protein)